MTDPARGPAAPSPISVLAQIRQATRARHDELEAGADILERLACPARRRQLLEAFLGLYEPAEAALRRRLSDLPGLDFHARMKSPALHGDLKALGAAPGELAALSRAAPPELAGTAHALGFAYVLEGSTLGGRVIRKRLRAAGLPLEGTSFFDVYGPAAGRRFTDFCAVLERESAGQADAAVAGALLGFDYVREGLVSPGSLAGS